jgi:hypothetical protein
MRIIKISAAGREREARRGGAKKGGNEFGKDISCVQRLSSGCDSPWLSAILPRQIYGRKDGNNWPKSYSTQCEHIYI